MDKPLQVGEIGVLQHLEKYTEFEGTPATVIACGPFIGPYICKKSGVPITAAHIAYQVRAVDGDYLYTKAHQIRRITDPDASTERETAKELNLENS